MPLTTNLEIQLKAKDKGYAVGAFNTSNLEITQAIIEAAEEMKSPVIIATSEKALKYAGADVLGAIIKLLAEKVEEAHSTGVSVEAELGKLKGVEDDISVSEKDAILTEPKEAELFVNETKCDALAIAIGTSHGAYKFKGEPKLDFKRLEDIAHRTKALLVLHGASSVISSSLEKALRYGAKIEGAKGIPPHDVKKAISLGITKVNIDTDLRLAFTAGIRELLKKEPEIFDPRAIMKFAKDEIKRIVSDKIKLLGSEGMA